jgi:glycosyltransferase involved in cell wall biosynthesis
MDDRNIPSNGMEIRAFMIVRNESLRLPFMLKHHFEQGIDRIFVLDNGSSDDTRSIVLSFDHTHLFYTTDNYSQQGAWIDVLLRRHGGSGWCLILDADEIFIYPDFENVSLRELCNFLDRESFDALDCVLLDMYPDRSLNEIKYEQGTDPLQIAPWFDSPSYTEGCAGPRYVHELDILHEGPLRLWGGMRKRVFGVDPCLSKVPLLKFRNQIALSLGTHWIQGARVADIRGALLHFKYLDDFFSTIPQEVQRNQRVHGNDVEYERYQDVIRRQPDLNLICPISKRFTDSSQLVNLNIMKTSEKFGEFVKR